MIDSIDSSTPKERTRLTGNQNVINEENKILDDLIKNKVNDISRAKALPIYAHDSLAAIILICNRKIEKLAARRFQNSTKEKSYRKNLGLNDSLIVTLYYQGKQAINIQSSTYSNNKEVERIGFNFSEDNECISQFHWIPEKRYSFYDVLYNDTIIRFEMNNRFLPISPSQKQQVIQSAKASLDSIMQHFPEFKYSFNWE